MWGGQQLPVKRTPLYLLIPGTAGNVETILALVDGKRTQGDLEKSYRPSASKPDSQWFFLRLLGVLPPPIKIEVSI